MSPNTLSHSLPLPRGWPHRIRSAVVQVISLARISLTLTQGWASENMNRQLRREAEGDRTFLVTPLTRRTRHLKPKGYQRSSALLCIEAFMPVTRIQAERQPGRRCLASQMHATICLAL